MDPELFELLTFLLVCLVFGAVIPVMRSVIELACFREQSKNNGRPLGGRRRYVKTMTTVTTVAMGYIVQSLFIKPQTWADLGLPDAPTYTPMLFLLAGVIAALVAERFEEVSEQPSTIGELVADLRAMWFNEEDLKQSSRARYRGLLSKFQRIDGGQAIHGSKRPLNSDFQQAINEALKGNYSDVGFTRFVRLNTWQVMKYMIKGHPWRLIGLALPMIAALAWTAVLVAYRVMSDLPITPHQAMVTIVVIVIGVSLTVFNLWVRLVCRLRKYCDLKRREALASLLLKKLEDVARSVTSEAPMEQPSSGILRRLVMAFR